MALAVLDEQRPNNAAHEPVCAFADRGNVSGQLAVAQGGRKIEAVDLCERRARAGSGLQKLEGFAKIR
jgi:hypothetical protein